MPTLSCVAAGAGAGTLGGSCNTFSLGGTMVTITATPNPGSTFGGWSCLGVGTASTESMSVFMPLIPITCTATFNLAPPPPVPASVESGMALTLTLIGVMLIAAFKSRKARKT